MKLNLKILLINIVILVSMLILIMIVVKPVLYKNEMTKYSEDLYSDIEFIDYFANSYLNTIEDDLQLLAANSALGKGNINEFTNYTHASIEGFSYAKTEEENKIIDIFNTYINVKPYIVYAYIGWTNGAFTMNINMQSEDTPIEELFDFDPRTRPWYISAMENPDEVILTEPYVFTVNDTTEITMTDSMVLRDSDNHIVGVIGLDFEMNQLDSLLRENQETFYGDLEIVQYQSNTSISMDMNNDMALNIRTDELNHILEEISLTKAPYYIGEYNGEDYLFVARKSSELPWNYLRYLPFTYIDKIVWNSINLMLVLLIVMTIIIMIAINISINRFIIRPINSITALSYKIAKSGSIDDLANIETTSEMNSMAIGLNYMFEELRRHDNSLMELIDYKTEKLLQFSEAIKQSPVMVVITDLDSIITYVNPKFTEVTGFKKEEVVGQNSRILNSDFTDSSDFKDMWDNITSGKEWRGELISKRRDGSIINEELFVTAIVDEHGHKMNYMAIIEDITEKKKAENEFILLYQLVYDSLEQSDIGAFWIDIDTPDIIYALDTTIKLLGLDVEINNERRYPLNIWIEKLDQSARMIAEYSKDIKHVKEVFESVTYKEMKGLHMVYPIICCEDSIKWISMRVDISLNSINGEKRYVSGTIVDITELKQLEKEIVLARDRAELATKAKSEFLANMSHEIRTPMNAIISLSTILKTTNLSFKQYDYVEKIHLASNNLLSVINEVLDFSKIEAGQETLKEHVFNIREIIENSANLVMLKASEKNIELIVLVDNMIPQLLVGDAVKLGQILTNLSINAVKFTDSGEVAINAILIEETKSHNLLRFSIIDTGVGIDDTKTKELFEPYSQDAKVGSIHNVGTGLGLSISKRYIELLGGHIEVKSAIGVGSTFSFEVWFKKLEQLQNNSYSVCNDSRTVLIVEDNNSARQVLIQYFNRIGILYDFALTGSQAIELVSNHIYDAIFLDFTLPDMNGYDVFLNIKNIVDIEKTPIVLLPSYGKTNIVKIAENEGIKHFLFKPVMDANIEKLCYELFENEPTDKKEKLVGTKHKKSGYILIVEDNEMNQFVGKELLEYEGYVVDIAKDGKTALNLAKKNAYDVILMDLQMPGMDGYETTTQIRAFEGLKSTPIIAVSADVISDIKDKVYSSGMNDFISKPINIKLLVETISKWMNQ